MDVLDYTDYRLFLKDWYWETKKSNKSLSFRNMSRRLGFKSPNHFHLVISEKRHLSSHSFTEILKILKPTPQEKEFLNQLFIASTSKDEEKCRTAQEKIRMMKSHKEKDDLRENTFKIIGDMLAWYIKSAAPTFEGMTFQTLRDKIRTMSNFPLKNVQVENAIRKLESMDLLKIENGVCRFEHSNVKTKWDHDKSEIKKHHENTLDLAKQTIPWGIQKRFFSSVTVPCDDEMMEFVKSEIRSLCLKVLEMSNAKSATPEKLTKVSTLHFSLFPFFEFKPTESD